MDVEKRLGTLICKVMKRRLFILESDEGQASTGRVKLCLVGHFLTDKTINVQAMQTRLS